MEFSGDYRIPAPVPRVWEALNDAEVLQACIPGCRELQQLATGRIGPGRHQACHTP